MHRIGRVFAGCVIALATMPAMAAGMPPSGAAGCSGCHTANPRLATSVPPLRGRRAAEIVSAMQEFRSGQRETTVMDRIAKGFTDSELQAIADWYAEGKD